MNIYFKYFKLLFKKPWIDKKKLFFIKTKKNQKKCINKKKGF
jgi:hypothetical protein